MILIDTHWALEQPVDDAQQWSSEIQQMVLQTPAQLSDDQGWCGASSGATGLKPMFFGWDWMPPKHV